MNKIFTSQIKSIECIIELKNQMVDDLTKLYVGRKVVDDDGDIGYITDVDIDEQGLYFIMVKSDKSGIGREKFYDDVSCLTFVE